jgi:rubrerythrin
MAYSHAKRLPKIKQVEIEKKVWICKKCGCERDNKSTHIHGDGKND